MNYRRRINAAFITLILTAVLIAAGITVGTLFPVFAAEEDRPVVIIDAGHEGFS